MSQDPVEIQLDDLYKYITLIFNIPYSRINETTNNNIYLPGKSGLGRHKFLVKRERESKALDAQRYTNFRQRQQAVQLQARARADLRTSKLACHQLDQQCGYSAPPLDWYWPEELVGKTTEEGSHGDGLHVSNVQEGPGEPEVEEEEKEVGVF